MGTATFLLAQGRFRTPNPNPNSPDPRRRRQRPSAESSPHAHRRGGAPAPCSPATDKSLVMGRVKILKRGEPLIPAAGAAPRRNPDPDLELGSTDRLGPNPELVRCQVRVKELKREVEGTYAGSGFFASPPPSSVPVPGFLGKKRDV